MWKSSSAGAGLATAALAAAAAVTISRRLLSASAAALNTRIESLPRRRPANVGDALGNVETPCLVIDLEAMERNLVELPRSLRAFPQVAIRPHAKAHKSAAIGRLQLHLSRAVGVCCQKVAEAEAMFAGGITDLLLSNEIVGADRYVRMAALATQGATVTLLFDHADAVAQAQQVACDTGIVFHALVDVNVGQNRCGVDSVDDALTLARQIDAASHLVLKGIQAYHGGAQHIRDYADKSHVILEQVAPKAQRVRDAFVEHGLCCDVVTGGGTGTYLLEARSGVFTEVQPGSYLFHDADYARNRNAQGDFVNDWVQSLFVLTTVMSVNTTAPQQRAVVDAGTKAVSLDSGVPLVYSSINLPPLVPPLVYQGGGDEHGILVRDPAAADRGVEIPMPSLGQKLLLTPGHCDPTVNMYDFAVGFRNGVVESVWHIGARGPGN